MLTKEEKHRIVAHLKQYRKLKGRIRNEMDHIAQLRAIVEDTSVHLSPVAGCNPSSGRGKFENTMLDIVTEEKKTEENVLQFALLQAEIENLINSLEDDELQMLLRYKYIDGMTFPAIGSLLCYSKSKIYSMHDQALEVIAENHPEFQSRSKK